MRSTPPGLVDADLQALEHTLLHDIPLAGAMQLQARRYDGDTLSLAAPLEPNRNDKGCAFGGSLVSLMTLAGWGLIVLHLRRHGIAADVYVQNSQVRYLAPVWADFEAEACLAEDASWAEFSTALRTRGRARTRTLCRVRLADGSDACTLEARFVAIAHS